jgi:hypothetical protein
MTLFEEFTDGGEIFIIDLHTVTCPLAFIKWSDLFNLLNFSETKRKIAWFQSLLSGFNQTFAGVTFFFPRV